MSDDCAWACSIDTDKAAFAAVTSQIRASAAASHSNFLSNGSIPLQGCSEFSLATYHDSNNACRGLNMLQMMYSAQADGFEVFMVSSYVTMLCATCHGCVCASNACSKQQRCCGYDTCILCLHVMLQAQGINDRALFWTWKMPYGGSHEAAWSVQDYFRRNDLPAASAAQLSLS